MKLLLTPLAPRGWSFGSEQILVSWIENSLLQWLLDSRGSLEVIVTTFLLKGMLMASCKDVCKDQWDRFLFYLHILNSNTQMVEWARFFFFLTCIDWFQKHAQKKYICKFSQILKPLFSTDGNCLHCLNWKTNISARACRVKCYIITSKMGCVDFGFFFAGIYSLLGYN